MSAGAHVSMRKMHTAIRRAARARLRQTPSLWKEYKAKRPRQMHGPGTHWYLVFLWFALPAFAIAYEGQAAGLLVALGFYCVSRVVAWAQTLLNALHASLDFASSLYLPISEKQFFDRQARATILSTWGVPVVSAYAMVVLASVKTITLHDWAVAASAGVLLWLVTLALAVALALFRPHWIHPYVQHGAVILALVSLFAGQPVAASLHATLLVTPMGWVTHGFAEGFLQGHRGFLWAWLPAIAVACALPYLLLRMRNEYKVGEIFFGPPELSAADLGQDFDASSAQTQEEGIELADARRRFMPGLMGNRIRRDGLPREHDWKLYGWVEGLIQGLLSERQHTLAEYMLAARMGSWTWWWTRSTVVLAAAAVVMLLPVLLPNWVFFLVLVGTALLATPFAGGHWPGFEKHFTAEQLVPCHAYYPIGYREMTGLMLRVNWIRLGLFAPAFLLACAALGLRLGETGWLGAWRGFEVLLLLAAVQPLFVVLQFSSGTNDTRVIHFESCLAFAAIALLLLSLLSAGVGIFVAVGPWQALSAAAFVFFPGLSWWLYGWLYEHGRVDTIRPPDRQ